MQTQSPKYTRQQIADWLNTRGVVWTITRDGKNPHSTRAKNPDGTWADTNDRSSLPWKEHEGKGYLAEGREAWLKGEGDLIVCPGTLPSVKRGGGHIVLDIDKVPVIEFVQACMEMEGKPFRAGVYSARKPGKEEERAHIWYQAAVPPGSGNFYINGKHAGEIRGQSKSGGSGGYVRCYPGEIEGVMDAYANGESMVPITAEGFRAIAKPRMNGEGAGEGLPPPQSTDAIAWVSEMHRIIDPEDDQIPHGSLPPIITRALNAGVRYGDDTEQAMRAVYLSHAHESHAKASGSYEQHWLNIWNSQTAFVKQNPPKRAENPENPEEPSPQKPERGKQPVRDEVIDWAIHGEMGLSFVDVEGNALPTLSRDKEAPEGFKMPDPKKDKMVAPMSEWGLDCALAFIGVRIRQSSRGGKRLQWWNGRRTGNRWQYIEDDGIAKVISMLAQRTRQQKVGKGGTIYFVPWRITGTQFISWGMAQCFDSRRVDPFLDWAVRCEEIEGGPSIEGWMADVFGLERSPYNDWHSAYPWLRMAELALRPGKVRSLLPLWVMSTGRNKTTALGLMLPPEEPEWFVESIDLQASNKERLESITGAVLGEVADMSPFMSRSMLAKAKAFITRKNDRGTRRAYARTEANEPRLVCLIATSDRHGDAIPSDSAGLRRFPPLVMPKVPSGTPPHMSTREVEEYFSKWRRHFMAQALRRVRDGEGADLNEELYAFVNKSAESQRAKDHVVEDVVMNLDRQKAYRMGDLIEIAGFIATYPMEGSIVRFTGNKVREPRVGRGDSNRTPSYRIQDALTTFGWFPVQRRLGGVKARWWIHPEAWDDSGKKVLATPYSG